MFIFSDLKPLARAITLGTALTFALVLLPGCSASIANLTDAKRAVTAYYENGSYEKDMNDVMKDAVEKLNKVHVDKSSVAIFDIDETSLSNYSQIKKYDFGFDFQAWEDWIQSGAAPPIAKTHELYQILRGKGVRIIFLTGRSERHYAATTRNLKAAGYEGYDTLIVRGSKEEKIPASSYKLEIRKAITAAGNTIVINVGDQDSDLYGGYSGIEVKLPNLVYCF